MLNIGRCVPSDFLMNKVTRFPIINLRRNWFCPCEFLCWNRSICQRRNLRSFFSLSSISIVFLWQVHVHVCVCHRSSKCLRNETVYDIDTSYERLHVHLHLHKLFKCSRFQRKPASYWCNNSHTYSKHQKVTNAQSQSSHVSGLFMSVLIVFRFQFHLIWTKTEFDSQNWPWKSNEDRLVTMCCIFCYLILVHPLIDLYCLHSSEWGIVCVTSSAFYENEFDNDYHNFFDFSDPK